MPQSKRAKNLISGPARGRVVSKLRDKLKALPADHPMRIRVEAALGKYRSDPAALNDPQTRVEMMQSLFKARRKRKGR